MDYHALGVALGRARGNLAANASTPQDAVRYEQAALVMLAAVIEGLGIDDGADYATRAVMAEGINEGHAAALDEAAREYGHEAARA